MIVLLIFITITLASEYYTFAALARVTHQLSRKSRLVILMLNGILSICIFLGFYALYIWGKDTWPSNAIKYAVTILMGVFLGKIGIAILMLVGDLILLFRMLFRFIVILPRNRSAPVSRENKISRSAFISRFALFCGAIITSGLAHGISNRYRYKFRKVHLHLNGLPDGLKGLRIAQISDIHSGSFDNTGAVMAGVDSIMDEKPDMILFTGDLVNFRSQEIIPYMNVFERLNAPLGVFSILGNHDYGDYVSWPSEEAKRNDLKQLKLYHKQLGWQLLLNEHKILKWKGELFALIGVENWSAKARFPKYGDLRKAMSGLESAGLPLKILMSHDPSHWDAEVRSQYPDVALTLSGHTHGMQFGIDIPGFKWSPIQYVYKQWAGLYKEKNQYLYVNRGFGFIGYQGRLGVLPEITLIELE
jgi:hypothetical protein